MLKRCKYLLLLVVGLFGFIGFSSANNLFENYTGYLIDHQDSLSTSKRYAENGNAYFCFSYEQTTGTGSIRYSTQNYKGSQKYFNQSFDFREVNYCVYMIGSSTTFFVNYDENTTFTNLNVYRFPNSTLPQLTGTCPECEECETCPTTGEILSGYCDINYCVENDLCPISSGSWSELVINDIAHEGKPLINISIPDYIQWDYTGDENQYDIFVGSGYDQDYIDSILKINSYRPDTKDFTQIFVSGLTLIFPYIFVALLIVFIWKLLKRVFK